MELWRSIHPGVLTLITLLISLQHLTFIAVLKPVRCSLSSRRATNIWIIAKKLLNLKAIFNRGFSME